MHAPIERGHNNPPSPIESAKEAMVELGQFAEDTPVIQNFQEAKLAAAFIERTRVALQAMEDERKPQVDPLNAKVEAINKPYRLVRQPLEKLYDLIRARLTKYNNAVEAARLREAQQLRDEAEAKERAAREALRRQAPQVAVGGLGDDQGLDELQLGGHRVARELVIGFVEGGAPPESQDVGRREHGDVVRHVVQR